MQQRLPGLTAADADTYLRLRLTREGEAAIPAEVRQKIVGASGGVPLYLELSAEYFDQLAADGQAPDPERFGGTFTEMVIRVMRDLTFEERSLLRASSLVDRFDAALLRAALPEVRDAAIERFFSRPIVHHEESGWLRRSVNEYIRAAVREHDSDTDDAWSQDEWRAAAARMVADLQDRLRQDANDPTRADRARLIQGFTTAGLLSLATDKVPDWLYDLAYGLRIPPLHAGAHRDRLLAGTRRAPAGGVHPHLSGDGAAQPGRPGRLRPPAGTRPRPPRTESVRPAVRHPSAGQGTGGGRPVRRRRTVRRPGRCRAPRRSQPVIRL
jgi:hypothetical protein